MPLYASYLNLTTGTGRTDYVNLVAGTTYYVKVSLTASTTCALTLDTTAGTNTLAFGAWDRAVTAPVPNPVPIPPQPLAAVLSPARIARLRAEEERARRRAERLLARCLSRQQRRSLLQHGYFEVVGSAGRTYRIHRGVAGNVRELDAAGRERARLCCHPVEAVPEGDTMAAQKMWIETDEAAFRRTANITRTAAA